MFNDYGEINWLKMGLIVGAICLLALGVDLLAPHADRVDYADSHITRMQETYTTNYTCAVYVTDKKGNTTCVVYTPYKTYTCDVYAQSYYEEYYNERCRQTGFQKGDPVHVKVTIQQDLFRLFSPYEVDQLEAA